MSQINLDLFNKNSNSKNKPKGSNNMIIGSIIIVTILFVLLAINSFWLFLTFFVLIDGFLLYKKNYKIAGTFLIIAIIIILWQFILLPYINKVDCGNITTAPLINTCPSTITENFYTLFTPFQREAEWVPKNVDLTALSANATKLWRGRKKKLKFGGSDNDVIYVEILSKLLLSRSKILNIEIKWENNPEFILDDLLENKTEMALIPSPVINRRNPNNINFLGNISQCYIFCISKVTFQVNNLNDIGNRPIGVPTDMLGLWKDIKESLFPYRGNITYDTSDNLFRKLKNDEIVAFFWTGLYPNNFLSGIINSETVHKYNLVPVVLDDQDAFLTKNIQYFQTVLDLSHEFLPSKYLPTGSSEVWSRNYTSIYRTIGYDLVLICNNKMDNFTGYEIAKTIFYGRNLISRHMNSGRDTQIRINNYKQSWHNQYNRLSPVDITRPSLPNIPVQKGAKTFYIGKGLISYCDEPDCKYVVGRERCTLCDDKIFKLDKLDKLLPKHFVSVPLDKVITRNKINIHY
jgi:hypothetical protein